MKQQVIELGQEELENIYGGEVKCIFLNGKWVIIGAGEQKAS